jgi:hypothetical protein
MLKALGSTLNTENKTKNTNGQQTSPRHDFRNESENNGVSYFFICDIKNLIISKVNKSRKGTLTCRINGNTN